MDTTEPVSTRTATGGKRLAAPRPSRDVVRDRPPPRSASAPVRRTDRSASLSESRSRSPIADRRTTTAKAQAVRLVTGRTSRLMPQKPVPCDSSTASARPKSVCAMRRTAATAAARPPTARSFGGTARHTAIFVPSIADSATGARSSNLRHRPTVSTYAVAHRTGVAATQLKIGSEPGTFPKNQERLQLPKEQCCVTEQKLTYNYSQATLEQVHF